METSLGCEVAQTWLEYEQANPPTLTHTHRQSSDEKWWSPSLKWHQRITDWNLTRYQQSHLIPVNSAPWARNQRFLCSVRASSNSKGAFMNPFLRISPSSMEFLPWTWKSCLFQCFYCETWCCVSIKSLFLLFFLGALYLLCATFSSGKVNTNITGSCCFFMCQTYNKLGEGTAEGQSAPFVLLVRSHFAWLIAGFLHTFMR